MAAPGSWGVFYDSQKEKAKPLRDLVFSFSHSSLIGPELGI